MHLTTNTLSRFQDQVWNGHHMNSTLDFFMRTFCHHKANRSFSRILAAALFFLLCSTKIFAQPNNLNFRYLTVDEGLSHTDANDIAQDANGFIWVATHFGLDRFDGNSVRQFYNSNAPINNALNNRLLCLAPDQEGNIWLGTENGLQCFNAKTEKYITYDNPATGTNFTFQRLLKPTGPFLYGISNGGLHRFRTNGTELVNEPIAQSDSIRFSDIASAANGQVFLCGNKGLYVLDERGDPLALQIAGYGNPPISSINFDQKENLLLAEGSTLVLLRKLEKTTQSGNHLQFVFDKRIVFDQDNYIKDAIQDSKGFYWVAANHGLYRLDGQLSAPQLIGDNKKFSLGLNSNSLARLFIDRSECLWICTFGGGVNYCDLNAKPFHTLQHNPANANSLSGNHIRAVLEEGELVWIGTNDNGLNCYDRKTQLFKVYNTTSPTAQIRSNGIASLALDKEKNLWVGTTKGIDILQHGKMNLLKPSGYENFPGYVVETLSMDCYGNMWFGNHMNSFGVIWKDRSGTYRAKYYGEGYFILANKQRPELFVSSTQGLKKLLIDQEGNVIQTIYYTASGDENSLSSNYTYPVAQQDDSTYWIGTIGGGLNRLRLHRKINSYTIQRYPGSGIFNDVETVEVDEKGNVWMGGNGLEYLETKTGKVTRYDKSDGLQGNSFKVGSSFHGEHGTLYFGGINGLSYFNPAEIRVNSIPARPMITGIQVNGETGKNLSFASGKSSARPIISPSNNNILNYRQNNFVIYFSAMHFANPLKCQYRYKLIGFDKEWQYTDGTNPSAAYNNLDYDKYTFLLQASNNDGIWNTDTAQTRIQITPPWWKSWLAKLVYILLIISALAGIYIYQARWYRLKREISVRAANEKKREEMHRQREELYQQQLMFFTNISHEFRTPLTLIVGPLEKLMTDNKDSLFRYPLELMHRNVKRLINLINELMNFKKVSDSVIRLQVQPVQIRKFCSDLAVEFQHLADNKEISFTVVDHTAKDNAEAITGLFDMQIVEKILFNLISNSFKYTDPGGRISFEFGFRKEDFVHVHKNEFYVRNEAYHAQNYLYFKVSDSGIGISGESIHRIFDRYYRVTNDHLGSGVGLALVKNLTHLHKGEIWVYSERHTGTDIVIGIPWGENNYSAEEMLIPGVEAPSHLEDLDNSVLYPVADLTDTTPTGMNTDKYVLIVDDNEELRKFLKLSLEKYYQVYEAADGEAAVRIATEKVPDLIISDVMMPGMDGIDLCKIIKETFETSHIPFIILSAKDALDTKLQGMQSGADYYFAKPLSIDLLLLTVHNIFEQSVKLKKRYTKNYLAEATELVQSGKDKEFLSNILQLIEENMQDAGLDVDFLCKQLHLSRTKLYQKIHSLSGQSVAEFIRTIRLKKAIQIMTHEDISMNEVANRIGMQSSSNFSRAFKKEFGKSPMQFIQDLRKN